MRNLRRKVFAFSFFWAILSPFVSYAQSSAEIGMAFLEISPSPRSSALADAYLTRKEDADALYFNPAVTVQNQEMNFSAGYLLWIEGMNHFSLFGSLALNDRFGCGIGLVGLSIGGIPETTDPGDGNILLSGNQLSSLDFVLLGNASYRIFPGFSGGANVKLISQNLAGENSYAFGADAGILYDWSEFGLKGALAVRNLGTPSKFDVISSRQPMAFSGGVSYDLDFSRFDLVTEGVNFNAAGSMVVGEPLALAAGAESEFFNLLILRIGYRWQEGSDDTGFRAGCGIDLTRFNRNYQTVSLQANYSFGLFSSFGTTHALQISASFRSFREKVSKESLEILRKADANITNAVIDPAVEDYELVLKKEPKHVRSAYNIACVHSVRGDIRQSIKWLQYVARHDKSEEMRKRIMSDPDLENVRNAPEFEKFIRQYDR